MSDKKIVVPVLGAEKETVSLLPQIFSVSASLKLLAQYVRVYLHNLKVKTALVKTRHFVTGSTRKLYKQKGTGRARHGSLKAPIFVGGGVAHGPKNLTKVLRMPRKMRQKALFSALSMKLQEKSLAVFSSELSKKIEGTSEANGALANFLTEKKEFSKVICVFETDSPERKYFRNLSGVSALTPSALNAYLVLNAKQILFSTNGLAEFQKLFVKEEK